MSEYKLIEEIILLSQSKKWDSARFEWDIYEIYFDDDLQTCLCGHYPIREICVLVNKYNNAKVNVGNVCVNKFLQLPSDKLFSSLKRVIKDETKSLNIDMIHFAISKNWITDWELNFYIDTARKRKLSPKQLNQRIKINNKIIEEINK